MLALLRAARHSGSHHCAADPALWATSAAATLQAKLPTFAAKVAGTRALSAASSQVAPNTSVYLRNLSNGAEVFLIGTAHVSERSAEEVRDTIRAVRPDTVFLELCAYRAKAMRQQEAAEAERSFAEDVAGAMAGGANLPSTLFKLGGSAYKRIFRLFGMDMGKEFRTAMSEADRIGAKVVYGDRSQEETIAGILQNLNLANVSRLLTQKADPQVERILREAQDFHSAVEGMKNRAVARAMVKTMEEAVPGIANALIHERDEIMARALAQERGRIVGVVGLAHLDGIERHWERLTRLQHLPT